MYFALHYKQTMLDIHDHWLLEVLGFLLLFGKYF